ncbi:MAG TPA: hypothetical protein VK850_00820 [Candidatus Binatia bacterium]|nr:hypothetical protein [Candidatus Binatia bacterium]
MRRDFQITVGIVIVAGIAIVVWCNQHRTAPARNPAASDLSAEVATLKARLAQEVRARQDAEAQAAALRKRVMPFDTNVFVSFRKVEDLTKRSRASLPIMVSMMEGVEAAERHNLFEMQRYQRRVLRSHSESNMFPPSLLDDTLEQQR